jgi:hypothetical protein
VQKPRWPFFELGCLTTLVAVPLAMPLAALAADPASVKPKVTASLDTKRIDSVSEQEKQLLRVEWTAARTRDAENKILDEIMGRLGRIEATTRDLRQVIESFPDKPTAAPATCAPTAPVAAIEPAAPGAPPPQPAPPPVKSEPPVVAKPAAPIAKKAPAPELGDDEEHSELPTALIAVPAAILLALLAWLARVMVQRRAKAKAAAADTSGVALRATVTDHHSLPPWDVLHNTEPAVGSEKTASILADLGVPDMTGDAPNTDHLAAVAQTTATATTEIVAPATASGDAPVEFDSTLELAEIMLSMGMASGAAQALVQRIQENPREALAHWLKLLDIYRKDGHRSDFERAAKELQQNFNIKASDWMSADGNAPSLENFDRVIEHVVGLWSQPAECIDYLTRLLEDNREGMRNGFPQPVAEEMMLLISILRETGRQ